MLVTELQKKPKKLSFWESKQTKAQHHLLQIINWFKNNHTTESNLNDSSVKTKNFCKLSNSRLQSRMQAVWYANYMQFL